MPARFAASTAGVIRRAPPRAARVRTAATRASMSAARKRAPSRATGRSRTRSDERVDAARELLAPLLVVEIRRERLDGPVVDLELATHVSPGRDEQQRAPPRRRSARPRRSTTACPARYASTGSGSPSDPASTCASTSSSRLIASIIAIWTTCWRRQRNGARPARTVALATVVATRRSAPRPLGSKLAVTSTGPHVRLGLRRLRRSRRRRACQDDPRR